jgi:hypothetical protein
MVALIVTCLPSLRPYLRRNFDASSASNSRDTNSNLVEVSQGTTLDSKAMRRNLPARWTEQGEFDEIISHEARISDESREA